MRKGGWTVGRIDKWVPRFLMVMANKRRQGNGGVSLAKKKDLGHIGKKLMNIGYQIGKGYFF